MSLLVLFTRIDQSPLFSDKSRLGDEKRRAQLLSRCRAGIDTALAGRRASRGIRGGHANRITVGGIDEVQADVSPGLFSRVTGLLRVVPLLSRIAPKGEEPLASADAAHPTRLGHNVRDGHGHAVSDDRDYVDVSRSGSNEVLERLDDRVVTGGRAVFGLACVDQTGWAALAGQESLEDLFTWITALP